MVWCLHEQEHHGPRCHVTVTLDHMIDNQAADRKPMAALLEEPRVGYHWRHSHKTLRINGKMEFLALKRDNQKEQWPSIQKILGYLRRVDVLVSLPPYSILNVPNHDLYQG